MTESQQAELAQLLSLVAKAHSDQRARLGLGERSIDQRLFGLIDKLNSVCIACSNRERQQSTLMTNHEDAVSELFVELASFINDGSYRIGQAVAEKVKGMAP